MLTSTYDVLMTEFDLEASKVFRSWFKVAALSKNSFLECSLLRNQWTLALKFAAAKCRRMYHISEEVGQVLGILRSKMRLMPQKQPSPPLEELDTEDYLPPHQ